MSQEHHDAYIIYDISQKNKKAFRLDHLGKEKVGLLDLHTKNIIKEIIDYHQRTIIGDLNIFKKAIPSPILKREVLIPHVI